jgi:hypothetical protein
MHVIIILEKEYLQIVVIMKKQRRKWKKIFATIQRLHGIQERVLTLKETEKRS